jgi:hypothetical protein
MNFNTAQTGVGGVELFAATLANVLTFAHGHDHELIVDRGHDQVHVVHVGRLLGDALLFVSNEEIMGHNYLRLK